ncbi:TetR/AcrR family transcriptional regulator [Mycolicibacterium sp. CH28]|uniref:TetR/AcrR family transcriptional regulator n=1 Tax=Mycolicibacterium sp. CH28 TaxID=2512237 RepID=UPI001080F585|nr:TetR family transcriptional regulator [Mycolicibacterium sp. CH28]TGD85209.1 TetR/AcrR family transcriptional regulator [Mycolicibacterium sp. CH28]
MTTPTVGTITKGHPGTGDRLLRAALEAFATAGFEGTSARQIERMAGVERGLVGYHFGTKQELWNRAVDALFEQYATELETLRIALRDVSKRERVSAMLMAYARFNARNPQFYRILVIEGHVKSERSERLIRHLRRAMSVFSDLAELSGPIPVETAIRWLQVIGAAGAVYSLSALTEPTFGARMEDAAFVDRFAAALTRIALEESAHTSAAQDPEEELVMFFGAAGE